MTKEENELASKIIAKVWDDYNKNPELVKRVAIALLAYANEAISRKE